MNSEPTSFGSSLEGSFFSLESAKRALLDLSRRQNFGISTRGSDKGKNKPTYFECDRSGKYRNRSDSSRPRGQQRKLGPNSNPSRQPGTSSQKCDCPWRVAIDKRGPRDNVVYQIRVISNLHNHPPSINSTAHRSLRSDDILRWNKQIRDKINDRHSVKDILAWLRRQDPPARCIPRDIYNFAQRMRTESLSGRTPISWLRDTLEELDYYFKIDLFPGTSKVRRLLYMHPKAIEIWKLNPDVLLGDCTYKTNRFNMPLLNIVGTTGGNRTPQYVLCFLNGEEKADYIWALEQIRDLMELKSIPLPRVWVTDRDLAFMQAIDDIFPESDHLLCRWHVNMNVVKNCKKHFATQEVWNDWYRQWQRVLNASDNEAYIQTLNYLRTLSVHARATVAMDYLEGTWLVPYKEKLVKKWTSAIPHYGNTATSRIEGNHAILKSYLSSSTGDMMSVFQRFQRYWRDQHDGIIDSEARERQRLTHSIQIPLLQAVVGFVYQYALRKIVAQKARLGPDPPPYPCRCGTPTYMGIPCWHKVSERLNGDGLIMAEDIHAHWWYDRSHGAQPHMRRQVVSLLNPDIIKGKGRPKGALGKKSQLSPASISGSSNTLENSSEVYTTRGRGRGRPRGSRGKGKSVAGHTWNRAGNGFTGTKRNPSAFEINPVELPSSSAPACLSGSTAPAVYANKRAKYIYVADKEGVIDIEASPVELVDLSEEIPLVLDALEPLLSKSAEKPLTDRAKRLLARNARSLAEGRGAISISTTQLALARGAGDEDDPYVPGTTRERAYMIASSALSEKQWDTLKNAEIEQQEDMDDEALLDKLSLPTVKDLDFAHMPPLSTAPPRMENSPDSWLLDEEINYDFEDDEDDEDWVF